MKRNENLIKQFSKDKKCFRTTSSLTNFSALKKKYKLNEKV